MAAFGLFYVRRAAAILAPQWLVLPICYTFLISRVSLSSKSCCRISRARSRTAAHGVMLTLAARCGSIMAKNDRYMGGGSTAFTGYALFGLVSSAYPLSSTVIDQLRDERLNP
jgi:hypothetical protein